MAGKLIKYALVVVLATLTPWLYGRYQVGKVLLVRVPSPLPGIYTFKSHDVKFRDDIRNCEDMLMDEKRGVAFLSCDAGRDRWNTVMGTFKHSPTLPNGKIYIYDYTTSSSSPVPLQFQSFPNEHDFHPLGIEWDPSTSTLFVVNHAHASSTIETFTVDVEHHTATHIRTLTHPLLHAPNSIHSLGGGKLFVTNDHYLYARMSRLLAKLETVLGLPIANVVYIDINDAEGAKVVARLPFANGIAMLNATTLAVGSSTAPGVFFYHVTADHDLMSNGYVRTRASVDNLSVDGDGKLLMAGHPYPQALIAMAERRAECVVGSAVEEEREACRCDAPSWAAEWTAEGGLSEIYLGDEICSSTTVVRDVGRGVGIINGLYDRGIMVFRE